MSTAPHVEHIHPAAVSYRVIEELVKAEERHSVDLGAIGSLHSHCFGGRGRGTFLPEARSEGPRRCLSCQCLPMHFWMVLAGSVCYLFVQ